MGCGFAVWRGFRVPFNKHLPFPRHLSNKRRRERPNLGNDREREHAHTSARGQNMRHCATALPALDLRVAHA
jgi:hypothetical protein